MLKSLVLCSLVLGSSLSCSLGADAAGGNARNLFLQQAEKPAQKVNTGVTYWLELERDKKKSRVSNKTVFQDKDAIKIHLKANFDGYAYVVMLRGSNGDKSVLFPAEKAKDNKIASNKELVLPSGEASFAFDENPGLETIRVVVSRKELDPQKELGEQNAVMIASTGGQQIDKIPNGTLVSIIIPNTMKSQASNSKNLVLQSDAKPEVQGETTVVSNDTTKPLSIDIVLNHQKKS